MVPAHPGTRQQRQSPSALNMADNKSDGRCNCIVFKWFKISSFLTILLSWVKLNRVRFVFSVKKSWLSEFEQKVVLEEIQKLTLSP